MAGMLCTTSPSDDTRTIRIFCTLKETRKNDGEKADDTRETRDEADGLGFYRVNPVLPRRSHYNARLGGFVRFGRAGVPRIS